MNKERTMHTRFSVVIPVYNKEKYLRRAVDSVLAQTYTRFELIVVDDGSTDSGLECLSDISDKRLRRVWQVNGGESAARNTGIRLAGNDLVAFLDGDDSWEPRFLERMAELRQRFPKSGLYGSHYFIKTPGQEPLPAKIIGLPITSKQFQTNGYFRLATGGQLPISASSVCVPKHLLEEAGLFPLGERMGADQHMWWRIALNNPIAFHNECLATYFQDADNRVCPDNVPGEELPFCRELMKAMASRSDGPLRRLAVYRYMGAHLIHIARENTRAGKTEVAEQLLSDWRTWLLPMKHMKRRLEIRTA